MVVPLGTAFSIARQGFPEDKVDMSEERLSAPPHGEASNPVRIGLALSGGGFRASLFHLGTIRYLEEVRIMPRVEVMSTVSGGSIIGAYYLVEMERKLRAEPRANRLEACDAIIREFCTKLRLDFRMRALVFYPFSHPVLTLLALVGLRHSGDTMAKEFEAHLFAPELRVGDLPVQIRPSGPSDAQWSLAHVQGTRILINTASLITGRRVAFSRESDLGIKAQIGKSDPNSISLARVVGASAAVPGLFRPLRIGNEVLADGGVVDNQGIESLLDYFEITRGELNLLPETFREPPELRDGNRRGSIYLIVSDGAGQFSVQAVPKATRATSAARSMSILQAANRRKVLKLLLDTSDAKHISGFAFTHMAMNIKGFGSEERLPSEFIGPTAELRTDLDEFLRLERDALIYHGYTLVKNQIRRYAPTLAGRPPSASTSKAETAQQNTSFCWPPPFVELCDPTDGYERRARESRFHIEKFLKVGRTAAFRDLRRFLWMFAPLLLVFLGLGRLLSHALLNVKPLGWPLTVQEFIRDRIRDAVVGVIPQVHIPYVINLKGLEDAFTEGGAFWGSIEFAASVVCIALSFYVALWLYWSVKRWLRLPSICEAGMMKKLAAIPSGRA